MSLPANIRINVKVPFPARVSGAGPITVTKANGIWTIGFSPALIAVQNPPANPASDQVFVWDTAAQMFVLVPLQVLVIATARPQRSITGAGNLPIRASDSILNINNGADLTPIVPVAAGRVGVPLTFKNLPGSHVQTLTRTAPDTFDGVNTLALNPGASITLVPYNDGVNSGYAIE